MKVRADSWPYLEPDESAIVAGPWLRIDGSELPDRLDEWDPATDLHIFRDLEIDLRLLRSAGLSSRAELLVVPSVRSDLTGIRVIGEAVSVDLSESASGISRQTISLHVLGVALGGTATISTTLVWMAGSAEDSLGPTIPGSVLWRDEIRCALEGDSARFPISPTSFSSVAVLNPDAAWTLDWDPTGLDEPMLGAVRLLVNTDHSRVRDSIMSGSSEPGADVVRDLVHFDVARTLIVGALQEQDFLDEFDSFADGTVGRAVADLIRMYWDDSPVALAARMKDFPRQFEMDLQARFPPVSAVR